MSGIIFDNLNFENDLVLFQSALILSGEKIDSFSLKLLPNNRALPEGTYQATMNVTPYRMSDGSAMNSEFQFKVDIIIMVSKEQVQANQNGILDYQAFNNTINSARFMLVMSEASLQTISNVITSVIQNQHSYVSIAQSAALNSGEAGQFHLHELPDGGRFKAGEYDAWLLRIPINQAEDIYAVSRMTLSLPYDIISLKEGVSAFSQPESRAIAQAVVNCNYLLELGDINIAAQE